jgi:hypothetical protein
MVHCTVFDRYYQRAHRPFFSPLASLILYFLTFFSRHCGWHISCKSIHQESFVSRKLTGVHNEKSFISGSGRGIADGAGR